MNLTEKMMKEEIEEFKKRYTENQVKKLMAI